jgi:hypothetical protein
MGGFGSGDWERWDKKNTADAALGLDVRFLARQGMLRPGIYTVSWSCGGNPSGSISVYVTDDRPMPFEIELVFRAQWGGKPWRDVTQRIMLAWTPCTYGGHRPWLVCPLCRHRAAIIYADGPGFYCRKCLGLVYQSQRESAGDRALKKSQAIQRCLGGGGGAFDPFPRKPPRMHWRTYYRLRRHANAADYIHHVEFIIKMGKLGARMGKRFDLPFGDLLADLTGE